MTPEQIALLAVFLLLPLLERLMRGARGGKADEESGGRRRRPEPPPVPRRDAREGPPPTTTRRPAVPRGATPPGARPAEVPLPVVTARTPPPPRRRRRRPAVMGRGRPGELRRAIAWTAILGPCRALDPYAGPEGPGGRPAR